MDAKSLNHFFLIRIAVQNPASSAVVIHVARKYDRLYRLASGSGHSSPTILAKLREIYSHSSVMTSVCQAVNLFDRALDSFRRKGGPFRLPLEVVSIFTNIVNAIGRPTAVDTTTRTRQLQRLVFYGTGPRVAQEHDLQESQRCVAGLKLDVISTYHLYPSMYSIVQCKLSKSARKPSQLRNDWEKEGCNGIWTSHP